MITVWGRRNSVNVQKVMWALGELGLDYERHDAGGSFGFPEDYETRNPNRVVPTIQDGGLTLWESNACVRYLASRYGQGSLWPGDLGARARADQWMDWQASTLNPAFFQIFLNMIRLPPEQANTAQAQAGVRAAGPLYLQLDAHLKRTPFMAGDAFTVGDIPVGALTHRYLTLEIERPELPNVAAWYDRLTERAAFEKHVMIPFGRNASEWAEEERKGAGVQ